MWCKEERERTRQRGLLDSWARGKSSPTLVRVWASPELMEPTGSTANFSWNHLSGLANLSRLLGLSPWFLALCCLPLPPRYIHKAWRYQEVTVGTEGYFVPSWFEEHWVDSTCVIHLDIVWPLTTAQVQPSIPYNDLYHSVFNGNLPFNFKPCEEKKMQSLISGISWCQIWWYIFYISDF